MGITFVSIHIRVKMLLHYTYLIIIIMSMLR
jgi:hypothetical protein